MRKTRSASFISQTSTLLALTLVHVFIHPATLSAAEDPIPLIDVVVEKTPPGQGRITYPVKTDSKGYIHFKSLPEGRYVVTAPNQGDKVFLHQGGPVSWKIAKAKKKN
jgi:hypothetical protein